MSTAEVEPPPVRSETPGARADGEVTVEVEEDGGIDAADLELHPQAKAPPPPKKFKGLRLSVILNALTLGAANSERFLSEAALFSGLSGWALHKGWDHVQNRSAEFVAGLAVGAWTGLQLMRRYRRAKRLKDRKRRMLGFNYGRQELQVLLGKVPYWVDFSRIEHLPSVNAILREMWRFYESAICKQIIETVEPIMMQHKPMFISAIKFKKLTFGDAPFKATHISVIKEAVDELVLEVGIRWDGSAHVAIGIEIVGAGLITPSVKRLNFFANVRIALTRMMPRMPGFGAVLISFQAPPLVTFDLDCGPGIGELISAWLIPFLKNDLLGNMLVWPNRIVVPLMPAEILGPLDTLQLHTRGVLKVAVVEARGLPKTDITGKGDPFAILETVALKPVKTRVIYNTDCPQWNETMYLKVQEVDQCLRVTVRDQESALVGALTLSTSEFQGRALIPLEELQVGEPFDEWYPLGAGDWGDLQGPGTGRGEIHLVLCYYPLDALRSGVLAENTVDATPRGLVFMTVQQGHNLRSFDAGGVSDPYCTVWLANTKKSTKALKNTRDPVWNESMDWANVSALETLFVEIYDRGRLSDRLLGKAKTPLMPIVKEFSQGAMQAPLQMVLELEGNHGDVAILVEWVPLDRNPLPVDKAVMAKYNSLLSDTLRGVLFVRLVSAEDLRNVDAFGLSDPYVILKIAGSPKASKFINNNLNPVWNETFIWSGVRETTMLHGEVKDKGTFKDKALGVFKVPVASLLDPPNEVHPFTLPLMDKETGELGQGRVNLQMCWRLMAQAAADEPDQGEPKWPDFQEIVSYAAGEAPLPVAEGSGS